MGIADKHFKKYLWVPVCRGQLLNRRDLGLSKSLRQWTPRRKKGLIRGDRDERKKRPAPANPFMWFARRAVIKIKK